MTEPIDRWALVGMAATGIVCPALMVVEVAAPGALHAVQVASFVVVVAVGWRMDRLTRAAMRRNDLERAAAFARQRGVVLAPEGSVSEPPGMGGEVSVAAGGEVSLDRE